MRRLGFTRFAPARLASGAFLLAGCATTGQRWVQQPEDFLGTAGSPELGSVTVTDGPSFARATEPTQTQSDEAPRRRLDHVVSLGEGEGSAPQASAGPSVGGPSVVVNIVNTTSPGYGYPGGYGYVSGYGDSAPLSAAPRAPRSGASRVVPVHVGNPGATPPLGHDWQAPPSYGPTFPYHTAPASAWERPR